MKQIIFAIRWPVSGIRNYIKYTFNNDVFQDYHFTIVAPDLDFSEFVNQQLDPDRFNYIPCGVTAIAMIKTLIKVCHHLPCACIHAHGFTALAYSIFPAFICRRKLFATGHDVFTPNQFAGRFGSIKRLAMTLSLNYTQATITVSEDCKQNILSYLPSVSANKLHPVLNGIDASYFAKAKVRPLKKELGLSDDTLLVGFLGRFAAQKGFRYVIDAVRILAQTNKAKNLKLVCFGWGGFIREEQEKITKLKLNSYFVFQPFADDVASAIKGLDSVIMPSLWEACGILAMEVLACGVPLIVSNCEGLREVTKGTPATVVDMRSAEGLAQAIELHLEHNQQPESLNYAKVAQERYCATRNTSPKTLKIYQSVVV